MMLTVITDDLVIDMEQVLYLSRDAHPYTLRFRGGAELELTMAEGQAVIAKLKEANWTETPQPYPCDANGKFVPAYPGGCDPFETLPADGATITDTCCDNEDEIDQDEYKYAVEACRVPVEEQWIKAKDCEVGVFYITKYGQKVLCVRRQDASWLPRFAEHGAASIVSHEENSEMLRSNVQSW